MSASLLRRAYDASDRKELDALPADTLDDVDWPNVAGGTRLVGHDAVRAYLDGAVLADPEGNEACICTWLDRV